MHFRHNIKLVKWEVEGHTRSRQHDDYMEVDGQMTISVLWKTLIITQDISIQGPFTLSKKILNIPKDRLLSDDESIFHRTSTFCYFQVLTLNGPWIDRPYYMFSFRKEASKGHCQPLLGRSSIFIRSDKVIFSIEYCNHPHLPFTHIFSWSVPNIEINFFLTKNDILTKNMSF